METITPNVEASGLQPVIHAMSQWREAVIALNDELGHSIPEFAITILLSESEWCVGARLRSALGVTVQERLNWTNEQQALARWQEAVGNLGVLIFQFSGPQQVCSMALPQFPLPVIGIDSKEISTGVYSFVLMCELVRLALIFSHEELNQQRAERFIENVASYVLIPEVPVVFLHQAAIRRDGWSVKLIQLLARKFWVTPMVAAIRLRAAGMLSPSNFQKWKEQQDTIDGGGKI